MENITDQQKHNLLKKSDHQNRLDGNKKKSKISLEEQLTMSDVSNFYITPPPPLSAPMHILKRAPHWRQGLGVLWR